MFTGIVDHCGEIKTIERHANGLSLWITCHYLDLVPGESLCIDGICLTVVEQQPYLFRCDISKETCRVTLANLYQVKQFVNIERALRFSDRLGGHFVTGHIDQTATVIKQQQQGDFMTITFETMNHALIKHYLINKGSVTVNGVSLTLNEILTQGFSVTLIPHTLATTNLKQLQIGDSVNIEFDYLAKIVAQQVNPITQHLKVSQC